MSRPIDICFASPPPRGPLTMVTALKSIVVFTSPLVGEVARRAGEGYLSNIVDFVYLTRKRDGGKHASQEAYDNQYTRILKVNGFKVVRFWNSDVLNNPERVLATLLYTPHPPLCGDLSHKGRGKGNIHAH